MFLQLMMRWISRCGCCFGAPCFGIVYVSDSAPELPSKSASEQLLAPARMSVGCSCKIDEHEIASWRCWIIC
ncbi:hypothetical protein B0H66DRAFT_550146 [Apodospora peruviana]|uniref:Secreted protein n=1 Tax=Apodospora peruviana TaxID=516989 RepID=A0AAE0IJL4_9PEZI|nr:hypothetical protein B0H66DRAFT_550146 [Apodospora peruviana]